MKNTTEDKLSSNIKQQLDMQAEQLDKNVTIKLDTLRQEALASAHNSNITSFKFFNGWKTIYVPALSMGLVLVIFISFITNTPEMADKDIVTSQPLQTDFEIVLTNEDFELLEEDLEFYLWLDKESETG